MAKIATVENLKSQLKTIYNRAVALEDAAQKRFASASSDEKAQIALEFMEASAIVRQLAPLLV